MDEQGWEMTSAVCGALFIVFCLVLLLFQDVLLPRPTGVAAPGGTSLLIVGGVVLLSVGLLHRRRED
jgi:hypothetical protein